MSTFEEAVRDVTRAMADAQGIPPSIIADIEAASRARSRPGPVCRCGFQLPADHPPAVIEDAYQPGHFAVVWNAFMCAPCARNERLEK